MSLSTTSTTVYLLSKYSRCYPPTRSHTASQQLESQSSKDEWQHFANPVMKVVLDIKKLASGELDSYRLRIIWSLNGGRDADEMDVDMRQSDVVFEDLELLAFSRIPSYDTQVSGLPLKAVYRDSIVGIRYLHPRLVASGSAPSYRRIQINFESADTAKKFIEAIQEVCPCKANIMPAPTRAATLRPPAIDSPTIPNVSSTQEPRTELTHRPSFQTASTMRNPLNASNPGQHTFNSSDTQKSPSSSQPAPLTAVPMRPAPKQPHSKNSTVLGLLTSTPADPLRHDPIPLLTSTVSTSSSAIPWTAQPSSNAPSSDLVTLPSPSPQTFTPPSSDPPGIAPPSAQHQMLNSSLISPSEPLLTALRETTNLYDLPHADLEYLVAEVVREDGFMKLLETLDSMWRLKGLLGMQ